MKNEMTNKMTTFLKEFNEKTNSKGTLIIDTNGMTLHSLFPNINENQIDKLAALVAVSDSIAENVNNNISDEKIEISFLINKLYYIIIKPIDDKYIFFSQFDRNDNISDVYDNVNDNFEIIIKLIHRVRVEPHFLSSS